MLGQGPLWKAAAGCHAALAEAGIPHALVGGIAVCLHGYQRNTVDVDVLTRRVDAAAVKAQLLSRGFTWNDEKREFQSAEGVAVQFLLSPDTASKGRSLGVYFPDPDAEKVTTELEGLPVVSPLKLIELKIARGLGNPRRMLRDFADVVELIAIHNLSREKARFLHNTTRKTYRELVLRARGEG